MIKDSLIQILKPYLAPYDSYLTGGYVRDFFLNKSSKDRDIAIKCDCLYDLCKKISDETNGAFVPLDIENEIFRIVWKDDYADFARLLNDNLEDDVKRRDFTINSIMYDIKNDKIIDLTGGAEDLKNGRIKTYNINNLKDDYLRMLRAFRFKASLGYQIESDITDFIKANSDRIWDVSGERIYCELMKIFEGQYLIETLLLMDETGLIEAIFPIFKDIKKVPKNSHHHLDLFHHLIETVKNITINKPELKLAAFLHDIGKPSTWTIEESGRHRFIGHDKVGADMVKPILKKLKFPKHTIDYISKMIENHIYPSSLMSSNHSEKAIIRFIRKINDDTVDLIDLAKADRLSARGEAVSDEMVRENLANLEILEKKYFELKPKLKTLPKLTDGYEIMKLLNKGQGAYLKEIIEEIKERQLMGLITTKEEAVKYILSLKDSK